MNFSNKRHIIFLLFNILLCNMMYAQNTTREEYIRKYRKLAVEQMNKYGIPASIILAQACLESADGNSRLATKGNNHFGIKCNNSWKGKRIYHNDDARGECFRKYNKAEDSYKDHSEFLKNGIRYQSLFDLKSDDYKSWAHGLKAAGYATNPKYAKMLIDIIEKNKLYEYDNKSVRQKVSLPGTTYSFSLNRQVYSENGRYYIIATGIETYSSLAKEYNLFESEILKFNNMKKKEVLKNKTIEAGTIVYITKKKR